jgi:hypothetical protein
MALSSHIHAPAVLPQTMKGVDFRAGFKVVAKKRITAPTGNWISDTCNPKLISLLCELFRLMLTKVKIKLSLRFEHHAVKAYWGMEV